MEMPTSCSECPFKGFDRAKGRGNVCTINEEVTFHAVLENLDVRFVRVGDCPLIPLPEKHGRLIDADALLKQKGDCYDRDGHLLYAVGTGNILCAPIIVEAEGD